MLLTAWVGYLLVGFGGVLLVLYIFRQVIDLGPARDIPLWVALLCPLADITVCEQLSLPGPICGLIAALAPLIMIILVAFNQCVQLLTGTGRLFPSNRNRCYTQFYGGGTVVQDPVYTYVPQLSNNQGVLSDGNPDEMSSRNKSISFKSQAQRTPCVSFIWFAIIISALKFLQAVLLKVVADTTSSIDWLIMQPLERGPYVALLMLQYGFVLGAIFWVCLVPAELLRSLTYRHLSCSAISRGKS